VAFHKACGLQPSYYLMDTPTYTGLINIHFTALYQAGILGSVTLGNRPMLAPFIFNGFTNNHFMRNLSYLPQIEGYNYITHFAQFKMCEIK
jgi:hypothetical protein